MEGRLWLREMTEDAVLTASSHQLMMMMLMMIRSHVSSTQHRTAGSATEQCNKTTIYGRIIMTVLSRAWN